MVAGTFNARGPATQASAGAVSGAQTNGAAGMVSIMFMVFAVVFGLIQKKFDFRAGRNTVLSIVFIILSFVIGANCPLIFGKAAWSYILAFYLHLLRSSPPDVAAQAAARLYDDPMFICASRRCGRRSGRCASDHEPCRYSPASPTKARHAVPDPVRHGCVRRGFRLPQSGFLRYVLQDHRE